MKTAAHPSAATLAHSEKKAPAFVALSDETRAAVDTETAAFHLSRRPQTLRCWAAYENGPIRPVRINGRLAWSVAELRRLLELPA